MMVRDTMDATMIVDAGKDGAVRSSVDAGERTMMRSDV
jgi:hypothetical protein